MDADITGGVCIIMPGLCDVGGGSQGFVHAGQALYQLSRIPSSTFPQICKYLLPLLVFSGNFPALMLFPLRFFV